MIGSGRETPRPLAGRVAARRMAALKPTVAPILRMRYEDGMWTEQYIRMRGGRWGRWCGTAGPATRKSSETGRRDTG